jgi:hypothetical protein
MELFLRHPVPEKVDKNFKKIQIGRGKFWRFCDGDQKMNKKGQKIVCATSRKKFS